MSRKPADPVKLNLRFTEALRARLEKHAARNNRSMNEEIIRRLEESFRNEDLMTALEALSERMSEKVDNVTVKLGDMILKQGRVLTVADVQGRPRDGDEQ
jgi:thioredoxin-like negative regulator of GroEL